MTQRRNCAASIPGPDSGAQDTQCRLGTFAGPARFERRHSGCWTAKGRMQVPLQAASLQALDDVMLGARRVRKDQPLFHEGEPLHHFHVVRAGSLKSSRSLRDGREHVSGFAFPGDMLGLDALASGRHMTTAVALEDAEVCAIPHGVLLGSDDGSHPGLRRALFRKLGLEIVRDQHMIALIANTNAEPRVATFILMVSARMWSHGGSPSWFVLRMSLPDIG